MASLPWFELDVDFSEHPKVMALCARLREPLADAYVIRLWSYCYRQATDRMVGAAGPDIVEMAARWRGKRGSLVAALLDVGLLDKGGPDLVAHGVADRLGPHLQARKNAAVRQRRRRDKLSTNPSASHTVPGDVTRDVRGDVESASRPQIDRDRDIQATAAAAGGFEAEKAPRVESPAPAPGPELEAVVAEGYRSCPVLDPVELGPAAAELRSRLERRAEWKFLVATHARKAEVRAKLEEAVVALGVDAAEALCWSVLERRRRQQLSPWQPKALAFFVELLEEAAKGGDPMPAEVPGVDVNQVQAAIATEVEARWAPLVARMNPAQREAYEAEKARLGAEIMSQGLWTTAEMRSLDEAEKFLFMKWSRKVAQLAGGVT